MMNPTIQDTFIIDCMLHARLSAASRRITGHLITQCKGGAGALKGAAKAKASRKPNLWASGKSRIKSERSELLIFWGLDFPMIFQIPP